AHTQALTALRPIRPTSQSCRSARQPKPGRRSTYRRGNSVQTIGTTSRVQAAEYIGVGVTKFDEMVGDGRMARPKRIDGRIVWDRVKLDEAFDALDDEAVPKNEWDDL
ncbi:MAG TPA: hypothetical protein VJX94_31330, partial [Stellaceae bacterium]|nr:hypothetical protein [Stellaceae bacterium]